MDEDLFFDYDKTLSDERNFTQWFMMNCSERAEFGEQVYTQEEGLKVFKQLFFSRSSDGG
tara:strand:- start:1550 stop:1729 length:180 start_codon:yes stop_codon:yes gene_type:complete